MRLIPWIALVLSTALLTLVVLIALGPRRACAETVTASFYGAESGHRTASGARFHPQGMTAAHRTLPFGTILRVCRQECVTVTVNDRGPFIRGRSLDLSEGAARRIGLTSAGVGRVTMEVLR